MPLACSRRHLGGSEPMHRARQFSQLFLGCIFKERPAQMEMEKPPAWFHWSFLFLVNWAALDIASLMAARHWCIRSLFANLENTGRHHLKAGRPKPSLKSSIFCPNLENQDRRSFKGVVQKPGCYRCRSMPYISMAFLLRPSSKEQRWTNLLASFFWELNQDEKLKESCRLFFA